MLSHMLRRQVPPQAHLDETTWPREETSEAGMPGVQERSRRCRHHAQLGI
jgi:hypothetical protein